MSDLEETISLAEASHFDQVEDRWLSHLADSPRDLEYFFEVTDVLVEAGEQERAIFLLDLLEENLRETGDWDRLLEVIGKTGILFRDPTELHAAIVETLRQRYADSANLDALIDKVGLLRAIEDTPKIWRKVDRLQNLMQFDEGAVVWMEGKGAGRVTEVNLALESFKLDLDQHPGFRVGFAAAPKVLKPLPEGHFLRQKVEQPEKVRELADSNPGELLLALLRSTDQPLTGSDIKQYLGSLVPASKWSSWWAEARKHPQVLSSGSSARQKYSWASSSDDAHAAIRESFDSADLDQQLMIFRKEANRSPELTEHMSERLAERANEALDDKVAEALVIWSTLERYGSSSTDTSAVTEVVKEVENFAVVVTGIPDRALRERLYDLATEVRPSWTTDFARAIRLEEDPRLLSSIASSLADQDRDALESALEDLTGQPRKFAASFVWLAENAAIETLVENRNPLRLLRQIFDAFHQPEFKGFQNRLVKVLEGTTAGAMIRRLDEDQASQAKQAIARAPVDDHIRDLLGRALEFQFPSLGKKKESHLYATAESIETRRVEMKNLIEVEIPANRKAIEEARELGDLRENFEYKSARQRHEYLNARVEGLQRDLERVRPFDPDKISVDEIRIGSSVVLRNSGGKEISLTIMGPWESDPDQGIISYASDLGEDLLGLRLGDSVDLESETFEVVRIGAT